MNEAISKNAIKWDDAFNSGDIKSLVGFYAPSAVVIPAGGTPVSGPEEIGKFFADLKSRGFSGHKNVEKVLDEGETQVAIGKWQLSGRSEDGTMKQYGSNLGECHGACRRRLAHSPAHLELAGTFLGRPRTIRICAAHAAPIHRPMSVRNVPSTRHILKQKGSPCPLRFDLTCANVLATTP